MEDLTTNYPFISLNRVSWNPNLGASVQLASGGHSGLVRIDILSSLRSATEEEQIYRFYCYIDFINLIVLKIYIMYEKSLYNL